MALFNKKLFILDIFTSSTLFFVLFYGRYASDSLDLCSSPLLTTDAVISVVCLRCFLWSVLSSKTEKHNSHNSMIITLLGTFLIAVCGTVLFHAVAVIFGAPLIDSIADTYHFACLLTATTFIPCCMTLGLDQDSWYRVLALNSPETSSESIVRASTYCSLVGAWLGAFPIPLDWDRPWQVWPISCVIGTTLGFIFGTFVSQNLCYIREKKKEETKIV